MDYSKFFYPSNQDTLTPQEHIRRRPGMYIGGTDKRALQQLIHQMLYHVIEEAYAKQCDHAWIELRENNEILICDNSNGLPLGKFNGSPFTEMEALLQDVGLSKFKVDPDTYSFPIGLRNIGIVVVNALCDRFIVENRRDGKVARQEYAYGKPVTPVIYTTDPSNALTGTNFVFHPDYSIFEPSDFDLPVILKRAQEIALLAAGLTVEVRDTQTKPVTTKIFHYPEGLKSQIVEANNDYRTFHEPIHIHECFVVSDPKQSEFTVSVEIAFQFSDRSDGYTKGFMNFEETSHSSTHITALKSSILGCLNEYIDFHYDEFGQHQSLNWNEVSNGLVALISVQHPDPQFASCLGLHMANPEIYGLIAGAIYRVFNALRPSTGEDTLYNLVRYFIDKR
jgi:DNA gyrase subunit B